jgi:hypothetical protein
MDHWATGIVALGAGIALIAYERYFVGKMRGIER